MSAATASAGARPDNNLVSVIGSGLQSGKEGVRASKGVLVLFAGANTNRGIEVVDKDLAVADLTGASGRDDRFDDLVGDLRGHGDFDLEFREEAHRIFRAAVDFRVPFLPPVPLDLGNCQAVHADGGERVAHLLELERL